MLQPPPEKYGRSRLTLGGIVVLLLVVGGCALLLLTAREGSRESAKRAQCLSNLKQIGLALHMYSQDHKERFPTAGLPRGQGGLTSLWLLYPDYASDPALFICPCDEDVTPLSRGETLDATHCSYGYDHAHAANDPADVVLVADYTGVEGSADGLPSCHYHPWATMGGRPIPNGAFVLHIDGHVTWSRKRTCGREGDDIFSESETLPPEEDSWITQ